MDVTTLLRIAAAVSVVAASLIWAFAPSLRRSPQEKKFVRLNRWGIAFLACALLTLMGSIHEVYTRHQEAINAAKDIKDILARIEQESYRITSSDFTLRVISKVSLMDLSEPFPQMKPIHVEGSLESAFFTFELEEVGDHGRCFLQVGMAEPMG